MYRHLSETLGEFYARTKKIPKEIGMPDKYLGQIGLSGTVSECHALMRKAVSDAVEAGNRKVINCANLDFELRRHARHAEATRRAVRAWGLEVLCANPAEYSNSLTAVLVPQGHDADRLRKVILEAYDMSLGTGLGKLAGKIFRIGHLGDFNDLMLAGTLAGVEMGLALAGVPHQKGGTQAAIDYLAECARGAEARKAA